VLTASVAAALLAGRLLDPVIAPTDASKERKASTPTASQTSMSNLSELSRR